METFKENLSKILEDLNERDKEEWHATDAAASESLKQLKLTPEHLPQRCQELLQRCSKLQLQLGLRNLDHVSLAVRQNAEIEKTLEAEYELLELRQKNEVMQRQIDRNNKFIEGLKSDLQSSKELLARQNPNPDSIEEHLKQMKQKTAFYDESYQKAETNYTALRVPESILPESLVALAGRLAELKVEEEQLKLKADEIRLARQARDKLRC